MKNLIKRNLLLFFKDKASVFFSLMSVFIILLLYFLFLQEQVSFGASQEGGFFVPSNVDFLTDSWMLAGVIAVTTMTTTLGGLGIIINDRVNKISKDLFSLPIKRSTIISSYILSAVFIGLIMSMITFLVSIIYIYINHGVMLSFISILKCMGVILLSTLSSGAMVTLVVIFVQTENAYGTLSAIIGTMIGFLAGVYMPIGILTGVAPAVKFFPVSHSASMLRQIMIGDGVSNGFSEAESGTIEAVNSFYGIGLHLGSIEVTPLMSIIYSIFIIVIFYSISLYVLKRKKGI